jgi:hypothetical protein
MQDKKLITTSYAGELMPTSCLENGFACGTVIPISMNGLEKISIYNLSDIIDKYLPVA